MNNSKIRQLVTKMGGVALVSSLFSLGVAPSAQAVLTTGISSFSGGSLSSNAFNYGFGFQATEDLTVTALSVYDVGEDGLPLASDKSGVDVGLWDDSGTLLGQVLVQGGTTAPILNGFRYENLDTSIDLTAGSFYRVAADMIDISGTDLLLQANPISSNGIAATRIYHSRFSFSFPTNTLGNPGEVALGGNILFDNTASASVPFEFSPTLGLLLVGGLFGGSQMYRSHQSKKIIN